MTTSFTPSSRGNVASSQNANLHTTSFAYSWGVLSGITPPVAGTQTTRAINPEGTVASETRRGLTTSFLYDGLFRQTKRTPALGNATVTAYDNSGGSWSQVTRGASVVTTSLDGFGRPTGTTDSEGVRTTTGYDACGRTSYQSHPFQPATFPERRTSFLYDGLDRVTRKTNPDTTYTTYTYLTDGIDVRTTDEELHSTTRNFSAFGDPGEARLVSVTEPETSATTSYSYNAVGSLTRVDAPVGADRVFNYNTKNQLESEVHPESGTVSYTYYNAGNVKTRTDARFGPTTFTYDGNERLTGINRPGTAYDTTIGYDGSDNRTLLTNGHVTSTFQPDNANRLDWRRDVIDGITFLTDYAYHGNDWLQQIDYPSGKRVVYGFDSMGRITSVTDGGSATYASQFLYHPSGALRQVKPGATPLQTFGYEPYRYWLTTSSTGHRSLTYGHDDVGNVLSITETSRTGRNQTFTYDALDRLKTARGIWGLGGYSYDAIGNRTTSTMPGSATQTYNNTNNRITSAGTTSFGHDANGNLTVVDGVTVYSYTPENMLETAAGTTYRYDGDAIRIAKTAGQDKRYYIHGPGGEILSEMTSASCRVSDSIYVGGRLLASLGPAEPVLSLQATAVEVAEDQGSATVNVILSTVDGCPTTREVTGTYQTADATATAGSDYTATSGTVSFPAGTASGAMSAISIPILNDTAIEPAEIFTVNLTVPADTQLGTPSQTVTILNDDRPTISISDVSVSEGNSGTTTLVFRHTAPSRSPAGSTAFSPSASGAPSQIPSSIAPTLPAPAASTADVLKYYELDAIGNVLVVESASGAVLEEHDYLPFGEELCGTVACSTIPPGQARRFTGKERDRETGLDYFGARYYRSPIGRFTSVDPMINKDAALRNPQRWNRFAYAANNPLRYVDPAGQDVDKAVATLKVSPSLGTRAQAALQPTHIRGIYAAEAARLSLLERLGFDGDTIGRGQLGKDAYADVVGRFGGDFSAYAKAVGRNISFSGDFERDMADADIEDFVVAGYFAIKLQAASQNSSRSSTDALRFAAGVYHGAYKTLRAAQAAVGDDIHYAPVESYLQAGNSDQRDLAKYIREVVP